MDIFTAAAMVCLQEVAYYESRNQTEPAQFAVIEATLRRVEDRRWLDTPCDVVYSPSQYEWTEDKPERKPEEAKSWEKSGDIAEIVVSNFKEGYYTATECADHFHDISALPWWTAYMKFEKRIGDVFFYCSDERDWSKSD